MKIKELHFEQATSSLVNQCTLCFHSWNSLLVVSSEIIKQLGIHLQRISDVKREFLVHQCVSDNLALGNQGDLMKCYTISRFSATLTLSLLNIRFSVFSLLLNRITMEVNLALFYQIVWISCRKFTEVSRSCYVHQKRKKIIA